MTETNPTTQSGEKVLIITRKSSFADTLIVELTKLGYNAQQENKGETGVKKIFDMLPQLAIVDVDLPDIDGYTVLEKKSADSAIATIPTFLLSTNGEPINMRRVPQNSVHEFIMSLHTAVAPVLEKINGYFGKKISPTQSKGGAKKILWVEDDKLIGTILSKKLISSGFDLTHAKSGDEAIAILSTNTNFDAALLDLILPGMSGFDILQKIKTNPASKKIPVMILSNLSKPSDIERAKILGAQKFIVKAAASLDHIVEETKELCG